MVQEIDLELRDGRTPHVHDGHISVPRSPEAGPEWLREHASPAA